jgi:hypothetical protein
MIRCDRITVPPVNHESPDRRHAWFSVPVAADH